MNERSGRDRKDPGILSIVNDACNHIFTNEGALGVVVIVVGNGHDDTSSNPGRD